MAGDSLQRERHTDSARRVVRHVIERALDRGMHSGELTADTAGMLAMLSMLRWESKVGRAALEHVGVPLDALARELDDLICREGAAARSPDGPRMETLASGQKVLVVDTQAPLSPLLDQAEAESRGLGRDYVGTEHLMLAAIRTACPSLRELLARHGVGYDAVKQAIVELLEGPPEAAGARPTV